MNTNNNTYFTFCRYKDRQGFHYEEEPDERKAHEGTTEYTSRDAHIGAHSRRGDLETLGYNMVHWLSGTLPWLNFLDKPEKVAATKELCMKDIPFFLQTCFGSQIWSHVLENYLRYDGA